MFAPGGSSQFSATARGPVINARSGGTATQLGISTGAQFGGTEGDLKLSGGGLTSQATANQMNIARTQGGALSQSSMASWGAGVAKSEPPKGGANLAFNLVGYAPGVTNYGTGSTAGMPTNLNTYQNSRSTNLVIRNVPGSNLAMSAVGMSG
jgi:hypothetical protein